MLLTPSLPKYLPKQILYTILANKIIWTSLNLSTVNRLHADTEAPTPCKQVIVTYLLSAAVLAINSSVSRTFSTGIQGVLIYKGLVVKGLSETRVPKAHELNWTEALNTQVGQSCPWVGLTHGLGWVGLGQDFWFFCWVELGWVGSTRAKVLKFERIMLMHLRHG